MRHERGQLDEAARRACTIRSLPFLSPLSLARLHSAETNVAEENASIPVFVSASALPLSLFPSPPLHSVSPTNVSAPAPIWGCVGGGQIEAGAISAPASISVSVT